MLTGWGVSFVGEMIKSNGNVLNRGPQEGTPNFGKPPYVLNSEKHVLRRGVQNFHCSCPTFRLGFRETLNPKPQTLNPKP